MPSTVNGIGTTYFGTSNRQVQEGICESCHRRGDLVSYETWYCICVLFVPIIPLGKKQILNYCPSCTRHRVMPLHEWVKMRETAIQETAAEFSASPDNPDSAMQMHATLAGFQKRSEALKLADLMEEKFASNVHVQFYLAAWYEKIGRTDTANRLFRHCFSLAPDDPAVRRAALLTMVEEGDLDDAKSLIEPFLPGTEHFDPAIFYALAAGFQKQGRHKDAVQTLRMLLDAVPELGRDKKFRKALSISEKAVGVDRLTIPSDPFYRTNAFLWLMGATAVVAALMLWNNHIAANRSVAIVNGLQIPISVSIDGQNPIVVSGGGRSTVDLAEGTHDVEVQTPPQVYPKVKFEIATNWWERFFRRPVFVLDPSRSTAVVWEEAIYTRNPGPGDEGREEIRLGESFSTFKHVDYPFETLPQQMKLDKKTSRVTRTRVGIVSGDVSERITQAEALGASNAQVMEYLQTHLKADPKQEGLLSRYVQASQEAGRLTECREFLRRRLADRPVLVIWHKSYQDVCRRGFPADARKECERLVDEYTQLVDKEPDDAALQYLRGRLETHGRLAMRYLEKALQIDPGQINAQFAVGYNDLVRGEFAKALTMLKQVMGNVVDPQYLNAYMQVQLAAAEYESLESQARQELAKSPFRVPAQMLLLQTLIATNRREEAGREFNAFVQKTQLGGDPYAAMLAQPLKRVFAAMKGDFNELKELIANGDDATSRHFSRLVQLESSELFDIDAAGQDPPSPYVLLCRELVARKLNDAEQIAASRTAALEGLDNGSYEEWAAADVLRRFDTVPWEELEDLYGDPGHKAVLLVAIAHERPDIRTQLLDLAEKLNFELQFPHYLLQRTIQSLR